MKDALDRIIAREHDIRKLCGYAIRIIEKIRHESRHHHHHHHEDHDADHFEIGQYTEPVNPADPPPDGENEMPNVPGTFTPLIVATDQPELAIVDQTDPLNIIVRVPPTPDRSLDTTVIVKDATDDDPTATIVLDWDGSGNVLSAKGFKIALYTEPVTPPVV